MVVDVDKSKVIKQIEYYFGPVNLTKDRFMRKELFENANCITYDTLLKFNRLKELVNDADTLKTVLEDVSSSLFEKTENGLKAINPPDLSQNEDINEKFGPQTLHIKGFPKTSLLDELKEWFESLNYATKSIHLRKNPDKKFKGDIFATFEDVETAKKFLEDETIKKYKDSYILKEWQKDCLAEEAESKIKRQQKKEAKMEEKRQEYKDTILKDVLVKLTNLPQNPTEGEGDKMRIKDFKEWLIEKLGEIGTGLWIDVQPEENSAILKFKQNGSATKVIEMHEKEPLVYKESKLELAKVPETEEVDYLIKSVERNQNRNRNGKRPGRGGYGGKGNKRRRN